MAKKTFHIIIILLVLAPESSKAQLSSEFLFASPGINIGYTLGAGITFGVRLDAGIIKHGTTVNYKYGLSVSYSWIHTKKHVHRMRTFGFLGGTDFGQVVVGWGRVRNKWGYGKRNRCITHGIFLDASIAAPNVYSPWIGIRTFRYTPSSWAWFTKPYNTVYTEYRYNTIGHLHVQPKL